MPRYEILFVFIGRFAVFLVCQHIFMSHSFYIVAVQRGLVSLESDVDFECVIDFRDDIKLLPKTPSAKSRTRRCQRALRSNALDNVEEDEAADPVSKKTRYLSHYICLPTFRV